MIRIFHILLAISIIGGLIGLIIYLTRKKKQPTTKPPTTKPPGPGPSPTTKPPGPSTTKPPGPPKSPITGFSGGIRGAVHVWLSDKGKTWQKYESTYGTIENWNTCGVANMSKMFGSASTFNQDISKWDVSSVTDMSNMFNGASAFNQNLSKWDVSSVTDMSYMFYQCLVFNNEGQPLSWGNDTSSVTNMNNMFYGAAAFNQDISSWIVINVTNMSNMFVNAGSFNQNISSWDVSNVTDMSYMFYGASTFNQDISSWTPGEKNCKITTLPNCPPSEPSCRPLCNTVFYYSGLGPTNCPLVKQWVGKTCPNIQNCWSTTYGNSPCPQNT